MKNTARIIAFLTACVMASALFSVLACAESDYTEYIDAPKYADRVEAYFLYNIDSRTLVAAKNRTQKINPGSLTKIMSGLLFCETLAERANETVTVTKEMQTQFSGKNMGLSVDEEISVRDLLHAAICGTYNDAAVVLAYVSVGGVAPFISLMNARAQEFGMSDTVFCDITGLNSGKDTTVADLAKLCEEAYGNGYFRAISSEYTYDIPATNKSQARSFANSNWLINDISGRYYSNTECCGLNSGNTDAAGWCVATVADYGNVHYICIVLGGRVEDNNYYSYLVANQLLSAAKKNFSVCDITEKLKLTAFLPVSGTGTRNATVALKTAENVTAFIPTDALVSDRITFTEQFASEKPEAPIKTGDTAGTLVIMFDGEEIGRTKILYAESVERNKIIIFVDMLKEFFSSRAFIAGATAAVVLTVLCLLFLSPTSRSSHRARQKSDNKIRKLR